MAETQPRVPWEHHTLPGSLGSQDKQRQLQQELGEPCAAPVGSLPGDGAGESPDPGVSLGCGSVLIQAQNPAGAAAPSDTDLELII